MSNIVNESVKADTTCVQAEESDSTHPDTQSHENLAADDTCTVSISPQHTGTLPYICTYIPN